MLNISFCSLCYTIKITKGNTKTLLLCDLTPRFRNNKWKQQIFNWKKIIFYFLLLLLLLLLKQEKKEANLKSLNQNYSCSLFQFLLYQKNCCFSFFEYRRKKLLQKTKRRRDKEIEFYSFHNLDLDLCILVYPFYCDLDRIWNYYRTKSINRKTFKGNNRDKHKEQEKDNCWL